MTHYLLEWISAYIIHFGVWLSLGFGAELKKDGIPKLKKLPNMFKAAAALAAILSVFTAHSQTHMLHHFFGK